VKTRYKTCIHDLTNIARSLLGYVMFRLAAVTSESFGVNVVHMDYVWLGDTVITGEFSTWLHGIPWQGITQASISNSVISASRNTRRS
jgi:hypothetical protein